MPDRIYANAIIKNRQNQLLGADKFARLLDAENLASCYKILQESGYADGIALKGAGQIDSLILREQTKLFDLLDELSSNKYLSEVFFAGYIFHNAKVFYKARWIEIDRDSVVYNTKQPEILEAAVLERNYQKILPEIAEVLTALDVKYSDKEPKPAEVDLALDKAMYDYIAKRLFKIFNKHIIKYYLAEAHLTNILTALRLRLKKQKKEDYYNYCVKAYKDFDFSFIVDSEPDTIKSRLAASGLNYAEIVENALKSIDEGNGLVGFETAMDEYLLRIAKTQGDDLYSLNPYFAYAILRLTELKNIKIILTAKNNKLPADKIKSRLRDIYA